MCKKIEDIFMKYEDEIQVIITKKSDYLNELSSNVFTGKIAFFSVESVSNCEFEVIKISIHFDNGTSIEETLSAKDCEITYGYDVVSDVILIRDRIKEINIM